MDQLKQDIENKKKEKQNYEICVSLLKDSGIKAKIIKQYLPIVNKVINKFLKSMNFYTQFELDEEFNEIIKSRFRDKFSYMSFSEGEKLRIDLALLFAWREVAKLKNSANCNLLILDEIHIINAYLIYNEIAQGQYNGRIRTRQNGIPLGGLATGKIADRIENNLLHSPCSGFGLPVHHDAGRMSGGRALV